jgi:hypothetical protein
LQPVVRLLVFDVAIFQIVAVVHLFDDDPFARVAILRTFSRMILPASRALFAMSGSHLTGLLCSDSSCMISAAAHALWAIS